MNNRHKQLDLDEAEAGMVLSEDVLDGRGGVLLPKATTLTDAMLASLRRHAIGMIYVVNDGISDAELQAQRAHAQQRLARLFRRCTGSRASGILQQHVTEYRLGDTE